MSQSSDSNDSIIEMKPEDDPFDWRDHGLAKHLKNFDVKSAQARLRLMKESTKLLSKPAPTVAKTGLEILQENYGMCDTSDEELEDIGEEMDFVLDDFQAEEPEEDRLFLFGSKVNYPDEDDFPSCDRMDTGGISEDDLFLYNGSDIGSSFDYERDESRTSPPTRKRNIIDHIDDSSVTFSRELGIILTPEPNEEELQQVVIEKVVKRRKVDEEEDRHGKSETDKKNKLYWTNFDNIEEDDDDDDDWYFTNDRRDVLQALSFYKSNITASNKISVTGREEKLNEHSSLTRVTTNHNYPLVIYFNQMYKPKSENKDGYVVANCAKRFPNDVKQTCPGAIHINNRNGEVLLHSECTHSSERKNIGLKLIIRKMMVMFSNKAPTEDLYNVAADLAHIYDCTDGLWEKEVMRRKILTKLGMTSTNVFPPNFNWNSVEKVRCLYDDTGNFNKDKKVTLIWVADGAEKYIKAASIINCDGKFSMVPTGFKQVYCISMKHPLTSVQIPLVFALTNSKSEETYETIFRVARKQGLNPTIVYSDFEKAAMNAAEAVWPLADVWGCWYHWKAAMLRKLKSMIRKDDWSPDFERVTKAVYGLSFAPLQKLDTWFLHVKRTSCRHYPVLDDFFHYLESTWFGQNAMFNVSKWHCLDRARLGHDYTNNGSEILFSKYQRLFLHRNYKILRTAVDKSVYWCRNVYRDVEDKRSPTPRRTRIPLHKDRNFLRVVSDTYPNFQRFNAAIYPYMHDPKIFH